LRNKTFNQHNSSMLISINSVPSQTFEFERQKLTKKQAYTKTEAYKLSSRVFCIFLPNAIKIDTYSVRFSPVWQRLYFLFGCHGLLLPVMLLFDVASPYISSIMRGDASLASRSAVSHDGPWIRVTQEDSERSPTSENQF